MDPGKYSWPLVFKKGHYLCVASGMMGDKSVSSCGTVIIVPTQQTVPSLTRDSSTSSSWYTLTLRFTHKKRLLKRRKGLTFFKTELTQKKNVSIRLRENLISGYQHP